MSNYSKATDFGAKDALPTGNAGKVIYGSEIDDEFDAIQTAVNSKADAAGPVLTGSGTAVNLTVSGTLNATGTLQINSVAVTSTAAELNKLDGVTATTAELNYNDITTLGTVEASKVVTADGSGNINFNNGNMTNVDIDSGTIDGTTQASGTINGPIAAGGTWTAAAAWTLPAITLGGTVTSNGQSFSGTIANLGTVTTVDINGGTIDGTNIGASSAGTGNFSTLSIGGVAITSTAAELNILDGVTATTAELNILDGVTATTAELNKLDGVTATTAELNYCDVTTKGVARAGEVWITDDFGFIGMSLIAQTGVSILSGDIDGTDIGATTPGTGAFTTLSASSTATFGAEIVEETGTLTQSGASMTLDPAGGTVQELTLSQSVTSTTDSLADGEYLTLLIDDGTAYTITWPTMEWVGGSAPTLDTTNTNIIELWKVGTTLYGAYVGAAS